MAINVLFIHFCALKLGNSLSILLYLQTLKPFVSNKRKENKIKFDRVDSWIGITKCCEVQVSSIPGRPYCIFRNKNILFVNAYLALITMSEYHILHLRGREVVVGGSYIGRNEQLASPSLSTSLALKSNRYGAAL